jgi:hypothetical protein
MQQLEQIDCGQYSRYVVIVVYPTFLCIRHDEDSMMIARHLSEKMGGETGAST